MTVLNVRDRRKKPYRFLKVNAVIEPTSHDNSIEEADLAAGQHEWIGYDEKEHVSVQEAFAWANEHPDDVTLYLYDEDGGIYVVEVDDEYTDMPPSLEEAAMSLHDHWIVHFIHPDVFSIGIGSDRLHAYIRTPKNRWPLDILRTWKKFPIEWHWNVGPIVAGG